MSITEDPKDNPPKRLQGLLTPLVLRSYDFWILLTASTVITFTLVFAIYDWSGLVNGLILGLFFGLTIGNQNGLTYGLAIGLIANLSYGLVSSLAAGLMSDGLGSTGLDDALISGMIIGLGLGLGTRHVSGMISGLFLGVRWGLFFLLTGAFAVGLAFGLTFGIAIFIGTWIGVSTRPWLTTRFVYFPVMRRYLREMWIPVGTFAITYLINIFAFACFYGALHRADDKAFTVAGLSGEPGHLGEWMYFSVVTATTLGYGEITPVSDWARFLVCVETIVSVGWVVVGFAAVNAHLQKRFEAIIHELNLQKTEQDQT